MRPIHPIVSTPASSFRSAAIVVVLALVGGCAVEDELDPVQGEEVPEEIERDGQTFELIGPVLEQEVEPGRDAVIRPLTGVIEEPEDLLPLEELTREELADQLRPVIATGGHTYVAQEPAWDAADSVLSGSRATGALDALVREGEGRPSVERAEDLEFRAIIGSDDRSVVGDTTAAPHNAVVQLLLYSGDTYRGVCTGSYIGPWTLITSAHCLVFSDTDRVNRIVFATARNGWALPYGSQDCRLDDASWGNDYTWAVPWGYYYGQNESLDYAVLDTYPCHSAPNWFGGYIYNLGDFTYSNHGYPADQCPGAPGPFNYQCGMSGPAEIDDWRIQTEHIDTMGGQSGSPWYVMWDTFRPAGVHRGYREYFDLWECGFSNCQRNYARRIDNAFHDFIVQNAWDY